MRVLIAFFSQTGNTAKIALETKKFFEAKKDSVQLLEIKPLKERKPKDYSREKEVKLRPFSFDPASFDVFFAGTPVWGFQATPIVVSFLNSLPSLRQKKVVLFASCHAFTGNAIKKMSRIVSSKEGIVVDSFSIKSLLSPNEKQLKQANIFCEKIYLRL